MTWNKLAVSLWPVIYGIFIVLLFKGMIRSRGAWKRRHL